MNDRPEIPLTQVRLELEVEKLVREAMKKHSRTLQAEVNRALRLYYKATSPYEIKDSP